MKRFQVYHLIGLDDHDDVSFDRVYDSLAEAEDSYTRLVDMDLDHFVHVYLYFTVLKLDSTTDIESTIVSAHHKNTKEVYK
jgi:hypothetical protein